MIVNHRPGLSLMENLHLEKWQLTASPNQYTVQPPACCGFNTICVKFQIHIHDHHRADFGFSHSLKCSFGTQRVARQCLLSGKWKTWWCQCSCELRSQLVCVTLDMVTSLCQPEQPAHNMHAVKKACAQQHHIAQLGWKWKGKNFLPENNFKTFSLVRLLYHLA